MFRDTVLRAISAMCLTSPLALFPAKAFGQDRPVEVPETMVETLDPAGVRAGSFVLYPRITADTRYDTNIYNQADGRSDTIIVARPSVRLSSDFPRHSLDLTAAAEARRYADTKEENSNQWSLQAHTRLDLADRFFLATTMGAARRIERRGTFGDQFFTDEPVSYNEFAAGAQFGRSGGIIDWRVNAATRKLSYNDAALGGVAIDESSRNVRRDSAGLRIGYHSSPDLGFYVQINGNQLRYRVNSIRDSQGLSLLGGVSYQVTDLVNIEAAVGYVMQDSDDPAERGIKAFDFNLHAAWTPASRAKFELVAQRSVERSPFEDTSSVLRTTITGDASVAIGSRMLVGLEIGVVQNDYRGSDRRDTRYSAEVIARYLITPKLAGFVGLGARKQSGSGLGSRSYDGASVRAGISFVL